MNTPRFYMMWPVAGLVLLTLGCKPTSEKEPYPYTDGWAPAKYVKLVPNEPKPSAVDVVDAHTPVVDAAAVDDRDGGMKPSGDTSPASVSADGAGVVAVDPAALPEIAEQLRAQLSNKTPRKQRREAKRLNRKGGKLNRRKGRDLEGAKALFVEALQEYPRFAGARFNLVRVETLLGNTRQAILHLSVLEYLRQNRWLSRARIERDLKKLRADPRFRRLTGFARVAVYGLDMVPRAALKKLTRTIRKRARFVTRVAGKTRYRVSHPTVLYRPDFADQAMRIAKLIDQAIVIPLPNGARFGDEDVAVVLDKEPDTTAANLEALSAFLNARLRGRSKGRIHKLLLKRSGFFEQQIFPKASKAGGVTIKRNGTYKVDNDKLVLSFSETRETADTMKGPEQKTARVGFRIDGQALVVQGVTYRR